MTPIRRICRYCGKALLRVAYERAHVTTGPHKEGVTFVCERCDRWSDLRTRAKDGEK